MGSDSGSSSSSKRSSSKSSNSSSSSSASEKPAAKTKASETAQQKKWADSSSEDEPVTKRAVMRSQSDKRYAHVKEIIKNIKNHMKIEDFAQLQADYFSVLASVEKLKAVLKEDKPPNFVIQVLRNLEEFVTKINENADQKKKMSKNKAQAFNTLRSKIKKGNKDFEDDLKRLEEHPSEFEDESSEEEEEVKEESSSAKSEASDSSDSDSSSSSSGTESDDEKSDGDWDKSDSDSSSDGDMDEDEKRRKRMQRWLKTDSDYEEEERERQAKKKVLEEKEEAKKKKAEKTRIAIQKGEARKDEIQSDVPTGKLCVDENLPWDKLEEKINNLVQQRGRKGFDRQTTLKMAEDFIILLDKHGATNWKIYLVSHLISIELDKAEGAYKGIRHESWVDILRNLHRMMALFETWGDDRETAPGAANTPQSFTTLVDCFVSHIESLDDELYKSLQFSGDASTIEFQNALQDSHSHVHMLVHAIRFLEKVDRKIALGDVAHRLLEQLHYRHDDMNTAVYSYIRDHVASPAEASIWVWKDSAAFFEDLRQKVYEVIDPRKKVRALLCTVFHLALHDNYIKARNLLYYSNTGERVADMDVNTQILYNRAIAQMGLCAFRRMMIPEAHNALVELCAFMKTKELLAQGMAFYKYTERTDERHEQEKKEKMRQVPFTMHIDLDLLESVHLISAMLLDIPNIAHQAFEPNNKKIISKPLRRLLEQNSNQTLQTPPENSRECVIAACRHMRKGDWRKCIAVIDDLRFWRFIRKEDEAHVRELLRERIKVESLRTYLFSSLTLYTAFQVDQLVDFFELDKKKIHSTISKMIINNEIPASWDSTSQYLVVQKSQMKVLHKLALEMAERLLSVLEGNERTLDVKCGNKESLQQKGQMQGKWDPQQNRRGYGRGVGGQRPQVLDASQGQRKGKGKGQKGKGQRTGYSTGWGERKPMQRDGYQR